MRPLVASLGIHGPGLRRPTALLVLLLAMAAGVPAGAQICPGTLPVTPNNGHRFGDVALGTSKDLTFRVCRPSTFLSVAGLVAINKPGEPILASDETDGPFTIVEGKTIGLGGQTCQNTVVRFRPQAEGAVARFILFFARSSSETAYCAVQLVTGMGTPAAGTARVEVGVDGQGSIHAPGIICPSDCGQSYPVGTDLQITAKPGPREGNLIPIFRSWDGPCAGQERTCTFRLGGPVSFSAHFGTISPPPPPPGKLTVRSIGPGTVQAPTWSLRPGQQQPLEVGYQVGTPIRLVAFGVPSSRGIIPFLGWDGACAGQGHSCFITTGIDTQVTARFGSQPVQGGSLIEITHFKGAGTVSGLPPGTCRERCSGVFPPTFSGSVELRADPDPGWTFGRWGWRGNCIGGGERICRVNLSQPGYRWLNVEFTPPPPSSEPGFPRLSVGVSGVGRVQGADISCPGTCTADHRWGTPLSIAAEPAPRWLFQGWTGVCAGASNPCQFRLNGDTSVQALFLERRFTLGVSVSGQGQVLAGTQPDLRGCCSRNGGICGCTAGKVACCNGQLSPGCDCSQIGCPSDCSESYPEGRTVSLNASARPGWTFQRWGGACTGQPNPCALSMLEDRAVTATFVLRSTAAAEPAAPGNGEEVPLAPHD